MFRTILSFIFLFIQVLVSSDRFFTCSQKCSIFSSKDFLRWFSQDPKPTESWNTVRLRITARWTHFICRRIFSRAMSAQREVFVKSSWSLCRTLHSNFIFLRCSFAFELRRQFFIAIAVCLFTIWIPILFTLCSSLIKRYLLGSATQTMLHFYSPPNTRKAERRKNEICFRKVCIGFSVLIFAFIELFFLLFASLQISEMIKWVQ